MGSDLRAALVRAMPEDDPRRIFYVRGRPHPPYNDEGILETFTRFKSEFLPLCPIEDCLGRAVRVVDTNFRKMLNLKHSALGGQARAYRIIEELEDGTFNASDYAPLEQDRIRTPFLDSRCAEGS